MVFTMYFKYLPFFDFESLQLHDAPKCLIISAKYQLFSRFPKILL